MKVFSSIVCLIFLLSGTSALGKKCEPGTAPVFEVTDAATEGITVTKDGTIYASGDDSGKIFKRTPDGTVTEIPILSNNISGVVIGLTSDNKSNVFAAVQHFFDENQHGVWRIDKDDFAEFYAKLPMNTLPNGVTFDHRGVLYVSDSFGGAIWRVPTRGMVELWVEDALLWDSLGFGFGVNGLDYFHGSIYGAITLDGRIVKVPINPDGSAGVPENYVESPLLFGVDHAILDLFGNLYAANVFLHTIVKVDSELVVSDLIADSDNVFKPASMSLGRPGDQFSIYVTNYENAFDWFPTVPRDVADVTRIAICPPGLQ